MKRELLDTLPNGDMLVIDSDADVFGSPFFIAGKIVTERRPVTIFKEIGTFKTKAEAVAALTAGKHGERS